MKNRLVELLKTPLKDRDEDWEHHFLKHFATSDFYLIDPKPQQDPQKGWPYLGLSHAPLYLDQKAEDLEKLIKWLCNNGVGAVLNPQKMQPDYIFHYGMIWHFYFFGSFFEKKTPQKNNQEIDISNSVSKSIQESILPELVRNTLKEFLIHQNILSPKVCLLEHPNKSWDIVFERGSLDNPENPEDILEAISWFLPNHYSLMLLHQNQIQNWSPL